MNTIYRPPMTRVAAAQSRGKRGLVVGEEAVSNFVVSCGELDPPAEVLDAILAR